MCVSVVAFSLFLCFVSFYLALSLSLSLCVCVCAIAIAWAAIFTLSITLFLFLTIPQHLLPSNRVDHCAQPRKKVCWCVYWIKVSCRSWKGKFMITSDGCQIQFNCVYWSVHNRLTLRRIFISWGEIPWYECCQRSMWKLLKWLTTCKWKLPKSTQFPVKFCTPTSKINWIYKKQLKPLISLREKKTFLSYYNDSIFQVVKKFRCNISVRSYFVEVCVCVCQWTRCNARHSNGDAGYLNQKQNVNESDRGRVCVCVWVKGNGTEQKKRKMRL